jgi:hypothetical protein
MTTSAAAGSLQGAHRGRISSLSGLTGVVPWIIDFFRAFRDIIMIMGMKGSKEISHSTPLAIINVRILGSQRLFTVIGGLRRSFGVIFDRF